MTLFIGIDPGLSGGIAVLPGSTGVEPRAWVMPVNGKEVAIRQVQCDLRHYAGLCLSSEILCCMEWAQAMPKQGGCSMFNYGMGFGMLRATLTALFIPHLLVRPRKWKDAVLVGTNKDKDAAIQICHRLLPDISLRRTPQCKTDNDGMADAICLALYAKNHALTKENA